jgi:hypothetical protein
MSALIHHPPSIINKYLAAKIDERFGTGEATYFFPTLPTDIDSLTQTFPNSNGLFAVYDRMFRMRRGPFPHIKCEQVLYYFYATGNAVMLPQEQMVHIQQYVSDLLDSGDESAEEINNWARENVGLWSAESKPVFFHHFKIYQLEEVRDIIDFGTARTYAGNKMIIDYDWHKSE